MRVFVSLGFVFILTLALCRSSGGIVRVDVLVVLFGFLDVGDERGFAWYSVFCFEMVGGKFECFRGCMALAGMWEYGCFFDVYFVRCFCKK